MQETSRKTFIIKLIAVLLFSIVVLAFVSHDYSMYSTSIARITDISTEQAGTVQGLKGLNEQYTIQHITARIMNGDYDGSNVSITNKYGKSQVYSEKYQTGDEVFVTVHGTDGNYTADISGMKRDTMVVFVLLVLLALLVLVGGRQGLFTVLSLFINVILFYVMLKMYNGGTNLLILAIAMSIIFSSIVLVLINGWNRRTLMSLTATLAAVAVIGIISSALIMLGPDLNYAFMDYIPEPYTQTEADLIFISEILMGGLGVIMDIAVTITATSSELIGKNPGISRKSLLESCRQVGDDITGAMINVVFFTNVASVMPLFILSMRNDISFVTVMKNNTFFETARFLTGAIGIIITIPLSILAASFFIRHGKRGEQA
ncbi:MAG: YibE/F family protein [Eubacteriaceae bacterium]|jgi:uncharacterized membrane protein|nr:YibE/F family protein [Eubacteriaceae bacterium]